MSFVPYPGVVRLPDGAQFGIAWLVGTGSDAALVAWVEGSTSYIAQRADLLNAFRMTAPAGGLELQSSVVNGKAWWAYATTNLLYYAAGVGWVYTESGLRAGWTPHEYQDGGTWFGDAYYVAAALPTALGSAVTFEPRGTLRGGASITISRGAAWPRWECATGQLGIYTPAGGSTGSRSLGCPTWTGPFGSIVSRLTRSNAKDPTGHYSYTGPAGRILAWDAAAGKFVLGVYGAAAGWHEAAAEPTPEQAWTLTFAWPTGADPAPSGSNYAMNPSYWVDGDGTKGELLVGSVAVYLGGA